MKIKLRAGLEIVSECLKCIAGLGSGSVHQFALAGSEGTLLPIKLQQLVQGTACNFTMFPWDHLPRREMCPAECLLEKLCNLGNC